MRRPMALAIALLLTTGAACGTRLDSKEIVAAHLASRGLTPAPAGPAPNAPGSSASPDTSTGAAAAESPAVAANPAAQGAGVGATPSGSKPGDASPPRSGATVTAGSSGSPGALSPGAGASARSERAGPAPSSGGAGAATAPAPPGAGAPGNTPVPAAGVPIVIGSVGTSSGIVGAAVGPGLPAVQAWVAAVNAAGGINGHPIKHLAGDDGGDPARHRQLVQQMVERDKVAAFVFNFAPLSGQSSVEYLTQKRVPVIGEQASSQWFYESPMFFPQQSTGAVWVKAMIRAAAGETIPQGKKKLAILNCQEAQFCVDADRLWPDEAPKVGYDLVFRRQASLAQPDYTAECLGARNAGAEVFGLAMDGNAIGRIASACARVGFHPVYFIHHGALLVSLAADPNLDGILAPLGLRAWFDKANPEVARYQSSLARYAPGQEAKDSSFMGWAAAVLFERAAGRASDPTTAAGILEGLWSLDGETLGDITYPLQYGRDQKAPEVLCWFLVRGSQGKWAYTDRGQKRTCSP